MVWLSTQKKTSAQPKRQGIEIFKIPTPILQVFFILIIPHMSDIIHTGADQEADRC